MRIQHNIMAMNAYRNYNNNTSALAKNLEKLSSGYRINRAGDDAAGLAISEKMRAQITALGTAQKNVKDGISLVKTAEGATQEIHDMLNRMVDLATQSANGTYQDKVDRDAIQEEYTALKTEINRIADASNFNGIKLLDGKLGLNTDAFSFSAADAVKASDGKIAGTDLALDDAELHTEVSGNSTQVAPAATIDLGNLEVKGVAAGATATVKITALGKEFTVSLDNTGGAGAKDFSTAEIAQALKSAMQADSGSVKTDATNHTATHVTTAAQNDSFKVGDAIYTIGGGDGTAKNITLTFNGWMDGTTYKDSATTTNEFTTTQADAFNASIGTKVSVGDVTNGTKAGDVIHDNTNVTYAQAKTPSTLAGVDIDISSLVAQGNTLTIDGTTYVFQTDAATTPTGGTVIDVSKGKTDEERIHMAVDLLSKQAEITGKTDGTANGRKWTISSAGDTKIHVDQTVGTTDTSKALKTYADVAAVISGTKPATSAKNVGTNIKIDNAKVADGDTLTIDDVKYVFLEDKTGKTDTADTKYVQFTKGGTDAATNLQAAISGSEINADKDVVTVRAATADGTAPSVLGKGLTLQIGEDSQDYNQLSVGIADMHTKSLGLDAVDLDTQTNAQAAVDVIKNAINQVSTTRGRLGATQNRLEHTANNLSTMKENIQDAEATIRDTDIAEEMMAYTKNNILVQSAQAMLAQANQIPQGVLQLLG